MASDEIKGRVPLVTTLRLLWACCYLALLWENGINIMSNNDLILMVARLPLVC